MGSGSVLKFLGPDFDPSNFEKSLSFGSVRGLRGKKLGFRSVFLNFLRIGFRIEKRSGFRLTLSIPGVNNIPFQKLLKFF